MAFRDSVRVHGVASMSLLLHEQACGQVLLANQPRCLVLCGAEDNKTPHGSAIQSLHEMRKYHDAAVEAAKASQCKIVSADLCQFILMTVVLQGLYLCTV